MRRRARRAAQAPRCRDCDAPITFFGSPFAPASPRPFNPKPLDGHSAAAVGAYPVHGRRAWRFDDLVDVIQVQRESSRPAAEEEVRDMTWYQLHACSERGR